jgi:hypothetical protein
MTLDTALERIAALVDSFPNLSSSERDTILHFAQNTPLTYGAWRHFKKLWKKAEAQALESHFDIELLSTLIARLDEAQHSQQSFRWKKTDETKLEGKQHSASEDEVSCKVGSRTRWDYRGFRVLVTHNESASGGFLQRIFQRARGEDKTQVFDLEAVGYVYQQIKKVELNDGILKVHCGPSYNWNNQPDSIYEINVADANFIFPAQQTPSSATFGYMKRRARRFLRHMSTHNGEIYGQLVMRVLTLRGAKALDPKINWILMDVLRGASPRWEQSAHGRGGYVRTSAFVFKRREERAQPVWDANLDAVREMFASPNVPPEASETALKILRAHGEEIRVLDEKQAARFWNSESPILQSVAARYFAEHHETLNAENWAQLLIRGNARVRRILNAPERFSRDENWLDAAARELENSLNSQGSKARRAARILLQHFDARISPSVFWLHLATFAALGEYSKAWVLDRVRAAARDDLAATLARIAAQPAELRVELLNAANAEITTTVFTAEQAFPLVASNDQAANALGWQTLASSAMTPETARDLWRRVWNTTSWFAVAVHETAAQSDGALQVFRRADFSGEEIENLVAKLPAFFGALSPQFFVETFRGFSPSTQVERALAASDEQWRAAREVLLETLNEPRTLGGFWNRVLESVKNGGDAALQSRLLGDAEISNTFVKIPAETIEPLLERTDASHEEFLGRWLDANISNLHRGDGALLFTAIHPMSSIRERGLKRLENVGLDLPVALRLMESELPQPFQIGRAWFQNNRDANAADLALALCDSPEAGVRAFGREFLEARREILDAGILQKLGENADPQMQAWLAENLLQDSQSANVQGFDRVVLRTRGKARRAKEAVKTRRQQQCEYSQDDVNALLEMARGRTARDREWALQQLAQMALSGQEIDGLKVENIGGASCK